MTLVDSAKVAFANTFSFYLKAHYYHWNVEGNMFPMLHEFFEKIYSEVYGSVDTFAEFIRSLDSYVPGTLPRINELTHIDQSDVIPAQAEMVKNLLVENAKVIASLMDAFKIAEADGTQPGFSNFLQDRLGAHKKHEWMLKATLR